MRLGMIAAAACVHLTFFRSAARGLRLPGKLTPQPTKHEGLQPRANERPRVGCCEELGGSHAYLPMIQCFACIALTARLDPTMRFAGRCGLRGRKYRAPVTPKEERPSGVCAGG